MNDLINYIECFKENRGRGPEVHYDYVYHISTKKFEDMHLKMFIDDFERMYNGKKWMKNYDFKNACVSKDVINCFLHAPIYIEKKIEIVYVYRSKNKVIHYEFISQDEFRVFEEIEMELVQVIDNKDAGKLTQLLTRIRIGWNMIVHYIEEYEKKEIDGEEFNLHCEIVFEKMKKKFDELQIIKGL